MANATGRGKPDADEIDARCEELARQIQAERGRPLLALVYAGDSGIREPQIQQLHGVLKAAGLKRAAPLATLDVLIHTLGGEPTTAYRLAQIVRDYGRDVTYLVPEFAYSGGTLMCLSANDILLGESAVLSPIDITIYTTDTDDEEYHLYPEEGPSEQEVELVAIDYFIQVAKQARLDIELGFRQRGWKSSETTVESDMLCEMTRQLGVLKIAGYYRERDITVRYAEELLSRCMFPESAVGQSAKKKIDRIVRRLVVESPSHQFPMDYHICRDIGLKVKEMDDRLSDLASALKNALEALALHPDVRKVVGGEVLPIFRYFGPVPEKAPPVDGDVVSATSDKVDGMAHDREEGTLGGAERINATS